MPSTVEIEHLGVAAVKKLCHQSGWFFREQPNPDEGIDAQIEASEGGRPSGKLLGVQIKSGPSYFRQPIAGGWRYRIEPRHLEYWRSYSLPVVLVLYDPLGDKAYWQAILSQHLTETAKGAHTIDVPDTNELTGETIPQLSILATNGLPADDPRRREVLRGRRIELDLGWMEMLQAGARLYLEVEQSLDGRAAGELRLIADSPDGKGDVEREWPWTFLPEESYPQSLREIFPWADLAIDKVRYRAETYPTFVSEHGEWQDDEWDYAFDCDFDTWFAKRFGDVLAPYGTRAGENVALWRLELKLNNVGQAALNRELHAMHEEAMFDDELEEARSHRRAVGRYVADFIESGPLELPALVFLTEDEDGYEERELLIAGRGLWSDQGRASQIAAAVLQHALAYAPTQGLAEAFLKRFGGALDDADGVAFSELKDWLDLVVR